MSKEEMQDSDFFDETDDEIQENKFLMCKIGDETYGIDIQHVTDIIELQKITEVPDMPQYVKGVINLRGNVIPVIDMRLRFGMESKEFDDRTVITVVNIKSNSIGFIVDTATEVVDIPEKSIDPPPSFHESGEQKKYIAGLGKLEDQVIILLDIDKLVGEAELNESIAPTIEQ